ncbi:hypothetical protein ACFVGN_42875, partial [Streptomyces sp. NPDC057757]
MPRPRPRRGHRRPVPVLLASLTAFATVLAGAVTADATTTATITADRLRTQHLTQALGIDDTTPDLSWE